jgi:hypothetical protein
MKLMQLTQNLPAKLLGLSLTLLAPWKPVPKPGKRSSTSHPPRERSPMVQA